LVKGVKNQNLIESVEIPAETRSAFENVDEFARNGCFSGVAGETDARGCNNRASRLLLLRIMALKI